MNTPKQGLKSHLRTFNNSDGIEVTANLKKINRSAPEIREYINLLEAEIDDKKKPAQLRVLENSRLVKQAHDAESRADKVEQHASELKKAFYAARATCTKLKHKLDVVEKSLNQSRQSEIKSMESLIKERGKIRKWDEAQSLLRDVLDAMMKEPDYFDSVQRIENERDEAVNMAKLYAIEEFLPLIEDIERAFNNLPESMKGDAWFKGAEIILGNFNNLLAKHEIRAIDPVGMQFDPSIHRAIGSEPRGDRLCDHVARTLEKGYYVKDRLLRPAMVIVAR